MIFLSISKAFSIALNNSSLFLTFVIPTDDPVLAGFTNIGYSNFSLHSFSKVSKLE